ncbi:MAG: hypothetical protein K0S99_568 [Thermomicrobiales bacterium]|jgi:hypothetical protein|nr:hypothetical protein [Thermomicrobiales bacterium]
MTLARARNIKPGFFTNDELAECGAMGQLLFAGLWTVADREGRLEDRPKKIKAQVFPYYDADVDALLADLDGRGFIQRYEHAGQRYIQVVNWGKHQSPHIKEVPSTIPAPDEHRASTVQAPDKHDDSRPDSLIPDSLIPDSGLLVEDSARARANGANAPELATVRPASKPKATGPPDDFTVTDRMREQATGYGVPAERIDAETERFLDHARANGKRFSDWPAAWRTWMQRAPDFLPRGSPVPLRGRRERPGELTIDDLKRMGGMTE